MRFIVNNYHYYHKLIHKHIHTVCQFTTLSNNRRIKSYKRDSNNTTNNMSSIDTSTIDFPPPTTDNWPVAKTIQQPPSNDLPTPPTTHKHTLEYILHNTHNNRARAATLRLPHGDVQTPVFMPVGL